MSYKIRHLNDAQRYEVARDFTPTESREDSGEVRNLTAKEREVITGILRGALLSLAWDDNRYDYPSQVAYACECVATFNPELAGLNHYDSVFCPIDRMLREIHVEEVGEWKTKIKSWSFTTAKSAT